jgi:hypothetical protein
MKRALQILARPWVIVALTILANLAIPNASQAAWEYVVCIDPETGNYIPCCTYCIFFCRCDEELLP